MVESRQISSPNLMGLHNDFNETDETYEILRPGSTVGSVVLEADRIQYQNLA